MKRSKMFPLVLSLMFILGFYGVAFSGGGEPSGGCENPPEPTFGPYLYGTFTVALDQVDLNDPDFTHYNVHIVLHRGLSKHLFSFPAPLGTGDLCGYDASFLKTEFAKIPCGLGVGEAFGLEGFPVISDLYITKKDFCGTDDEMILGVVMIRVVAPPKPPRH